MAREGNAHILALCLGREPTPHCVTPSGVFSSLPRGGCTLCAAAGQIQHGYSQTLPDEQLLSNQLCGVQEVLIFRGEVL